VTRQAQLPLLLGALGCVKWLEHGAATELLLPLAQRWVAAAAAAAGAADAVLRQ
jgi:hypothetical protein